jgi:AraC-like DNA-binding protein
MTHREIARTLGYADEFHFSRRFRAQYGVPPRDYRRP